MDLQKDILIQYKKILIKAFKAFQVFCQENGITYYACGGTSIGAIRHKGIIPWDDDIDVCMLRDEYERFLSLRYKLADSNYEVKALGDEGYPLTFAKFCDTRTAIQEIKDLPCQWGVFIDIFPMDTVSGMNETTIALQREYYRQAYKYMDSYKKYSVKDIIGTFVTGGFKAAYRQLRCVCWHRYRRKKYAQNCMNIVKEAGAHGGKYILNFFTPYKPEKEILQKAWFSSSHPVPFEDTTVEIPNGVHEYLTQLYGDYMTPPPPEKRVSQHGHYKVDLGLAAQGECEP